MLLVGRYVGFGLSQGSMAQRYFEEDQRGDHILSGAYGE
jgi:hypothetical protein